MMECDKNDLKFYFGTCLDTNIRFWSSNSPMGRPIPGENVFFSHSILLYKFQADKPNPISECAISGLKINFDACCDTF